MTLFLVKVIGVVLTILAFPGFFLIFSLKKAFEAEEANISKPAPIDESYSNNLINKLIDEPTGARDYTI